MAREPNEGEKKYYIYWSSAGQTGDLIPEKTSNTDSFLSFLQNKCIILQNTPDPSAELDSSDEWAKWLYRLDPKGQFSVTIQGPPEKKQIESFTFQFHLPLLGSSPVVFSSSTDALASSFGPNNGIPQPGIEQKGELLYAGLDLSTTSPVLKTTVKNVLEFVGDMVAVHFLPAPIQSLTLTLDVGQRNALWFSPRFYNQTTLRLNFRIDALKTIQDHLGGHLDGLSFDEASVICKKILIRTTTAKGPIAVDQGGAAFVFGCMLRVNERSLALQTSVDFRPSSVSVTLRPVAEKNALETILMWLAKLVDINPKDVEDVLGEDTNLFENVRLREVTLRLAIDEKGNPTGITSFSASIQISTKMGRASEQKSPVFFLTYRWQRGIGKVGELEGHFWSGSDQTTLQNTSPSYEWWKYLTPTPDINPAESISLVSMIPDTSLDNIPNFIPTEITAASMSLSDTRFAISAIIATKKPEGGPPHPSLGLVKLRASYSWGENNKGFSVDVDIMSNLMPASTKPNPTMLTGRLSYHSATKGWLLEASLEGLYASSLYEFFDEDSSNHVMPLIDSIQIRDLTVRYEYEGRSGKGRSAGSKFNIDGALLIAGLELDLEFSSEGPVFKASLKPQDANATIGEVIAGILGDNRLELPDFIANTQLSKGNTFEIEVKKEEASETKDTGKAGGNESSKGSFHFIAQFKIGHIQLFFAQYHGGDWPAKTPSKRLFKVALQGLEIPEMKLIGKMGQPFHEMAFTWVQDPVTKKDGLSGLTRKEVKSLNDSLSKDPLIFKDRSKEEKDGDVLITAGSHFAIITKDASGKKSCVLDYEFKGRSKKKAIPPKPKTMSITAEKEENEDEAEDGKAAKAPFKKKAGPLSLKNIGLKYANKQIYILFDATLDLGPLEFSLLGFSIGLEIPKLNEFPTVHTPTIEGFSIGFEKRPLTIAGIIRHGKKPGLEYYAGGLVVGFVPYEFIAAGFYGDATDANNQKFVSMFLFVKLNGPLFSLGFADISGVTGGFGYNSEIRTPAVAEVPKFPFVATREGEMGSALDALDELTKQDDGRWFAPKNEVYWAAAGMKVNAFQMLSIDAVAVVQFGQSIKLGIFAVAIADIPSSKASLKFAHVELGLAVVVDFDYGTMKVEGQLSPNSYILHADCHLTGGFGLYYWFDAPHADKSVVGEFVFTIGGYHQAFIAPAGYPRPPRLGINWSYSSKLSITGEAYFAITPKACMGGGRLHASFSAGPITAWFDALADFLINYRPFNFNAFISISVGVKCSIDVLFIHTSVSAELGASLTLWGPPLAGRVHVDFWVTSFDIDFGQEPLRHNKISLVEFYELVVQAGDKPQSLASLPAPEASAAAPMQRPKNEGHTFLALSGLVNAGEKTEGSPTDEWTVRGGTFSFSVTCKMAAQSVSQGGQIISHERDIYSKPMHLDKPMASSLMITIRQDNDTDVPWRMEAQTKSVPTALWDRYSTSTDPAYAGNDINQLLHTKNSTLALMMGVVFNVPPPILSPDKLPAAGTADKNIEEISAEKEFPPFTSSAEEWGGVPHSEDEDDGAKWNAVHDTWNNPSLGTDGQAGFVSLFAKALKWGIDGSDLSKLAGLPKNMNKRFDDLFIAAPLISTG